VRWIHAVHDEFIVGTLNSELRKFRDTDFAISKICMVARVVQRDPAFAAP
jgi:hypothetical protein